MVEVGLGLFLLILWEINCVGFVIKDFNILIKIIVGNGRDGKCWGERNGSRDGR